MGAKALLGTCALTPDRHLMRPSDIRCGTEVRPEVCLGGCWAGATQARGQLQRSEMVYRVEEVGGDGI